MSGVEITIDTEELSKKFDEMLGKLSHFQRVDIGAGLSAFQTEDLHRNRPFTMRSRAKGLAATKIRPHSLYEMQHSARARQRVTRYLKRAASGPPRKRRRKPPRFYVHTSTRPILREEMYAKLFERMHQMLEDKIKW